MLTLLVLIPFFSLIKAFVDVYLIRSASARSIYFLSFSLLLFLLSPAYNLISAFKEEMFSELFIPCRSLFLFSLSFWYISSPMCSLSVICYLSSSASVEVPYGSFQIIWNLCMEAIHSGYLMKENGKRDRGTGEMNPGGNVTGEVYSLGNFPTDPFLGIRLYTYSWLIVKLGMPLVLSLIKAGTQRADYHLSCLLLPTIPVAK